MTDPIRNNIAPAPVSRDEALRIKVEVEEALSQLRKTDDWDEYKTMEQRADESFLEGQLKGTLALIDNFLKTGSWELPEGSGRTTTTPQDAWSNMVQHLHPGWNGDVQVSQLADHPTIDGWEYAGTVDINDGANPTVGFQAFPSTIKIEAENSGKDIIYKETYKDDQGNEKKRFWVGTEHATKVNARIVIDAHTLTDHGIVVDLHKAYRISDGSGNIQYGTPGGFTVVGSDLSDELIGSQGDDFIAGLKGNDVLRGEAGQDWLYGDDWDKWATARGATTLKDGDDDIDGGVGKDWIDGGLGRNKGYDTDVKTGADAEMAKLNIQQNIVSSTVVPPDGQWLVNQNGWTVSQRGPGQVELTENYDINNNSNPSELDLKMPEGFEMASAEAMPDGSSMKITMVRHPEGQPPQTFTIIVHGILSDRTSSGLKGPMIFKFDGNDLSNIIDFHTINFGNNSVSIGGGGGDDIIAAPINDLVKDGLSFDDLLHTSLSRTQTQTKFSTIIPHHDMPDPNDPNHNLHAEGPNGQNEIEVSRKPDSGADLLPVNINGGEFDKAYVMEDPDPAHHGDLLVVLVKNGVTPETLVVRIQNWKDFAGPNGNLSNISQWLVISRNAQLGQAATPGHPGTDPVQPAGILYTIPLLSNSGTTISGGEGTDFAVRTEQDTAMPDVESGVTGHYTDPAGAAMRVTPQPTHDTPPVHDDPPPPPADPNYPH